MRIHLKRWTKFLLFVFVFASGFTLFLLSPQVSTNEFSCHHPVAYQNKLHELAATAHNVLNKLNVTHFLCYESLWAALYNHAARSWDDRLDLCVLARDLERYEEAFLITLFKTNQLDLLYDSAEGEYRIQLVNTGHPRFQKTVLNDPLVTGRLVVFSIEGSMAKRTAGWKRRLLPPDCEISPSLDCFPSRLVEAPLPVRNYGPALLPSPREELEIQKYHYPDDWWLQRHIPECSGWL